MNNQMQLKRAVALVSLVAFSAACMGPRRAVDEPGAYISTERPDRIWLTDDNGTIVVEAPRVFGDSLFGWSSTEADADEIWLGLADVRSVEVQRLDPVRTGILAVAVTAAAVFGLVLLSGSGSSNDEMLQDDGDSVVRFHLR